MLLICWLMLTAVKKTQTGILVSFYELLYYKLGVWGEFLSSAPFFQLYVLYTLFHCDIFKVSVFLKRKQIIIIIIERFLYILNIFWGLIFHIWFQKIDPNFFRSSDGFLLSKSRLFGTIIDPENGFSECIYLKCKYYNLNDFQLMNIQCYE